MVFTVLTLWAISWFKSPGNHETPTTISHRRAEVTSGDKCVQHSTTSSAVIWSHTCHSSASVPCNSFRPTGHFFTYSLDTQTVYRGENQWEPRGQLSGGSWRSSALRCVLCLHQDCKHSSPRIPAQVPKLCSYNVGTNKKVPTIRTSRRKGRTTVLNTLKTTNLTAEKDRRPAI